MKRVRKRAPLGQSTSAQISSVLSPPFFHSFVRWDQKGTNVPHFMHLHRIFTYKGTQGTGDAGHTLHVSKYIEKKMRPRKCQNAKFRSSSQCCYCYCKEVFTITPKSSPQSQPALCNFLQISPYCTIICFLGPLVGSGLVFAWYHTVYEFLPSGLLDMQNTELCTFRLTD